MTKFQSLARRTKASNAKYAQMSRAEKRVTIAKDVIKAIAAEQIIPTHGDYFSLSSYSYYPDDQASLQDLLPTLPACNVCAKGAILICGVARQNKVTYGQADDWGTYHGARLSRVLGGVFSPTQLSLIEEAFEDARDANGEETNATMTKIMKNIVKNGGTFKPIWTENAGWEF